jgi:hypothetical protein
MCEYLFYFIRCKFELVKWNSTFHSSYYFFFIKLFQLRLSLTGMTLLLTTSTTSSDWIILYYTSNDHCRWSSILQQRSTGRCSDWIILYYTSSDHHMIGYTTVAIDRSVQWQNNHLLHVQWSSDDRLYFSSDRPIGAVTELYNPLLHVHFQWSSGDRLYSNSDRPIGAVTE